MSEGMTRGTLAGNMAEMRSAKVRVHCQECGSDRVYRVLRKGYFQEKIYPLFGYYPWQCMKCGVRVILHKRGRVKARDFPE